jgi:hypothetical protein
MDGTDAPDNSDLPALLAEIAGLVGRAAALRLAEARGGTTIFVPAEPKADHWLSQLIGHSAAVTLAEHFRFVSSETTGWRPFNGQRLVLPSAARVRRRTLIIECCMRGTSINETALAAGVTERTVCRYRARLGIGGDT